MIERIEEIKNILNNFDTHWEANKKGFDAQGGCSEASRKEKMRQFYQELLSVNRIVEEKGIEYLVNSWRYNA